jgi:hypothetical protein
MNFFIKEKRLKLKAENLEEPKFEGNFQRIENKI